MRDGAGSIVGASPLRAGVLAPNDADCVSPFGVSNLPAKDFYTVEVTRGEVAYSVVACTA